MTTVRTVKGTKYTVEAIENGELVVRQPSGKRRKLTRKEVGTARYYAAVEHFRAREGATGGEAQAA